MKIEPKNILGLTRNFEADKHDISIILTSILLQLQRTFNACCARKYLITWFELNEAIIINN